MSRFTRDASFSYLLCYWDSSLWLFDAHADDGQPIKIDFKPKTEHFRMFVGQHGRVHVVDVAGQDLWWHVIDPATGQTLSSEQKHSWDASAHSMGLLHHAGAQRVLGMVDHRTIAIMEADTRQEVSRCLLVSSADQLSATPVKNFDSLAWSQYGDMLAVTQGNNVGFCAQVRIHDTASGLCLQFVLARALCCSVAWSPANEQLVMLTLDEQMNTGNHIGEAVAFTKCSIRVLQPDQQRVVPVLCSPEQQSSAAWTRCSWTPCGSLLVAEYDCKRPLPQEAIVSGLCIVDPGTGKQIFHDWSIVADTPAIQISWTGPHGPAQRTVKAYLPEEASCIHFQRHDGRWQAVKQNRDDTYGGWLNGRLIDEDVLQVLHMECDGSQSVCHYHVQRRQGYKIASGYKGIWPPCDAAAPFARGWPQVYAFVHQPQDSAQAQSVTLVDIKLHKVLGSWTVADLAEAAYADALPGTVHVARWAPDGRDLAILCNDGRIFVMTFNHHE